MKTLALLLVNIALVCAGSKFEEYEIVPDVIDKSPDAILEVTYPNNIEVKTGNVLTPTAVKDQPSVKWNADPDSYYTLIMTDPDAPSRKEPKVREWHHWISSNIKGGDLSTGEVLTEYVGSGPPQGSGLHRYVFMVFKQPGELKFDEKRLTNRSAANRPNFSTKKFAAKYNLGQPIAGNFYQAEWDDYVPILYKQLGG